MIPVCRPTLEGNEIPYVYDCMSTGWIGSSGKYIGKFEEMFARWCGAKYAVSCSNGTTALHLAVSALGIGPGDEVILPSFTIVSCGNAVQYNGGIPVFIDSDPITRNMDITQIEKHITKKTKAIMVVHTYGNPVDMDAVMEIANKHKLFVIEDAAEAHGALYKGQMVGSFCDIGCFSFFSNKIVTTGEGGMCVTNDKTTYETLNSLKNLCFIEPRFYHNKTGYNYRMSNIQAAIGVAQMERADEYVTARIENAKKYKGLLRDIPGITLPNENKNGKNVYWMFGIEVDKHIFGMDRNELMEFLKTRGVETRTFFCPLNTLPIFPKNRKTKCPIAKRLWETGLYLPSATDLTDEEILYVCDAIREAYDERHKPL